MSMAASVVARNATSPLSKTEAQIDITGKNPEKAVDDAGAAHQRASPCCCSTLARQDPILVLHRRSGRIQDRFGWRLRKPRHPEELATVLGPNAPAGFERSGFIGRDRSASCDFPDKCFRIAVRQRFENEGSSLCRLRDDRQGGTTNIIKPTAAIRAN